MHVCILDMYTNTKTYIRDVNKGTQKEKQSVDTEHIHVQSQR